MSKEKYKKYNIILQLGCFTIAGAYLYLLFKIVFFKYMTPAQLIKYGINTNLRGLSLNPFADLAAFFTGKMTPFTFIKNFIGNIGLFIPLGMILPLLFTKLKEKQVVLCGALFSLFIEIVQYIFCLGITDIVDIILNTTGVVLGLLLYKLITKCLGIQMKIRIACILSLTIMGSVGVAGIYYTQAGLLFHAKTIVNNIEVLDGLNPLMSDDCGKLTALTADNLRLTVPSYTDQEGNTLNPVNTDYVLSDQVKFYKMVETYKYAGNSLVRTTQTYSRLTKEEAIEMLENAGDDNKSMLFADVYLKEDNNVKSVILDVYTY